MNNIDKINNFLQVIKKFMMENPGRIDTNFIYSRLCHGISNFNRPEDISFYFKDFLDLKFKNMYSYRNERASSFCLFKSKEYFPCNDTEIKLYVPLDKEHIYNGAVSIFRFLDDNNIKHQSKVANTVRSDDIVIRVSNREDALKVIEFVNNNKYLKEGAIDTNPFVIKEGNVGLSHDATKSYNYETANLIHSFLQTGLSSVNDFKNYANNSANIVDDKTLKKIYKIVALSCNQNRSIYDIIGSPSNIKKEEAMFKYKQDVFLNACFNTLEKYGKTHLIKALSNNNIDYKCFTRDGNSRELLSNYNITNQDVNKIIKSYLRDFGFDSYIVTPSIFVNMLEKELNKTKTNNVNY